MSEQPEELDFEERRRRLEQLFAAEPHLSPTMRARQLSEPAEAPANGHHPASNGHAPHAPLNRAEPVPPEMPADLSSPGSVYAPMEAEAPRADGMLSIALARQELAQRADPADQAEEREPDLLDSLRNDVLERWRDDMFS